MLFRQLRQLVCILPLILIGAIFAGPLTPASASFCALADHIQSANTNRAVGNCPAGTSHDIITITEDITLNEALPPITGTITIEGNGHTISGGGKHRIFDVQSGGKLTVKHLNLIEGNGGNLRGGAIRLGRDAHLRVEDSAFRNNEAKSGGAIGATGIRNSLTVKNSSFVHNSAELGGAMALALDEAVIENSSFSQNLALDAGAAISTVRGDIDISNSTFHSNVGNKAGAIFVDGGIITLTHLTMLNNAASGGTGAGLRKFKGIVYLRNSIIAGSVGASECFGRLALNAGNLIEDRSCNPEFSGDPKLDYVEGPSPHFVPRDGSPAISAAYRQFCPDRDQIGTARPHGRGCDIGAIESTSASAQGAEPLAGVCTLADHILAANSNQAVGACPAGTDHDIITITEDITLRLPLPPITGTVTIEGGGHTISGDGKFRIFVVSGGDLTVNNLTLTDGYSDGGGGGAIQARAGGSLNVNNSSFNENVAHYGGGAIDMLGAKGFKNRLQGIEGATLSPGGRLTVNNSQFYRNRARGSYSPSGGAIRITGVISISNSSFISNSAGGSGGAIDGYSDSVSISNSTFSGNRASTCGGALDLSGIATLTHLTIIDSASTRGFEGCGRTLDASGNVRLRNSIIAGDIGSGGGGLCADFLNENVGNIIEDGSCLAPMSGDAGLGELTTGASPYYPLLDGSPAIDAADARFCIETDQLGNPRPGGGGCDIGAIESTSARAAAGITPADCALHDQIVAANTDQPAGNCPAGDGADTISLTRDITLEKALPPITSDITIEGFGYTINGAGRFRLFDVDGGALTLENVTLTDGKATKGGAIRLINGARVAASNVAFSQNAASEGGAIASESDDVILEISDSIFVNNSADQSGGALMVDGGAVDIIGSAFLANRVVEGQVGGAMLARRGRVAVSNSTFSGNRAGAGGANCDQGAEGVLTHVSLVDEAARRIAGGIFYQSGFLTLRDSVAADRGCHN